MLTRPDPRLDVDHAGPPSLAVIHADAHLLVLDKPSGLHTVPAKPPSAQDCLAARAAAAFPGALLVHRLDRDTSGLVVFALSRLAQRHLGWQFERRQVAKTYQALVAGHLRGAGGRIELPLACDWPNRPRQMVCPDGKPALTDWRLLAHDGDRSRLALHPLTGRSHQLRVHCAAIGHPILGDPLYGDPAAAPRLMLHATRLAFRHPDGGAAVGFASPPSF